ncbi:MAG: hypothetical protein FWD31_07975 [Planctomycetaceae bacterium]|nr:hypothetical protein [Planctomycetaceae bacterium]
MMRNIDTVRFVWLPCVLFILCTEIVCATSGWGNVQRSVGNDCYVSLIWDGGICCVTTNRDQIRIRVWGKQRPEYDFNSSMIFFRFHQEIVQDDDEQESYPQEPFQAEKIDFDYVVLPRRQKPIMNDWTYFIVDKDKASDAIFGPFIEAEFMKHPEATAVKKWNWKSPKKTQSEQRIDELTFSCFLLAMFFCVYLWWIVPLFLLILIVVRYRRRKKRLKST